jgi:hypothetical protein
MEDITEPDSCPVCLEEFSRAKMILMDSNQNHEIISPCQHWFCQDCLKQLFDVEIHNCPMCRADICELISTYEDKDEETESDE